jgi:hypothetical protein
MIEGEDKPVFFSHLSPNKNTEEATSKTLLLEK